jgi:hypothetical protein
MTALARVSCNYKLQTRPLVKEGSTSRNTQLSDSDKNLVMGLRWVRIWSWVSDGCPTPRQTDRLTVGRDMTSASASGFVWGRGLLALRGFT